MRRSSRVWVFMVLISCCQFVRIFSTTCTTKKCTCNFDDSGSVAMDDHKDKINAWLAGTIGALSALLLVGSGIGLYCCCKKRKSNALYDSSRPSTSSSDTSVGPRNRFGGHPPPYNRKPWSTDDETDSPDSASGYSQPSGPFGASGTGAGAKTGNMAPMNIYRSGLSDDINVRIGQKGTPLSYGKPHGAIRADW